MAYHLKETVKKIAEEKNLGWTSFRESRVRDIERRLEKGVIGCEEAMAEIEKEFHRELDRHDFDAIRKKLR